MDFSSEAGLHKKFDECLTGLVPRLQWCWDTLVGGIFHGPTTCQSQTVLAKEGVRSKRAKRSYLCTFEPCTVVAPCGCTKIHPSPFKVQEICLLFFFVFFLFQGEVFQIMVRKSSASVRNSGVEGHVLKASEAPGPE